MPEQTMKAYISLGSNLGDRAGHLLLAVRGMMASDVEVTRLSNIYETEPVGKLDQPAFLNMVAELNGGSLPRAAVLLQQLQQVEFQLGRTREEPMGPRTIDLDLLLYGNEQHDSLLLTIPHPRLHLRRFVLEPLAELCPSLVVPVLDRTVSQLLATVQDSSRVERWLP